MLKKYIIRGLLIAIVFLILVAGRVFYLQRTHFLDAEKYFVEANWKLAIREYDTAMHFYTPWSPYIEKSASRLWQIGEIFERQGMLDWAHMAYSSIRSSFYASRSLYTPGKDWINKCDEKIADLNVKMLINEGSLTPDAAQEEKQKHLFVLKVDRAPDAFWSVLSEICFFGWLGSVILMILKGFHDNGKFHKKFALFTMASFMLSFSIWIVALLKA